MSCAKDTFGLDVPDAPLEPLLDEELEPEAPAGDVPALEHPRTPTTR